MGTAEMLIRGLKEGLLEWRELRKSKNGENNG
jgi:hypothetical protein